ncbi:XK-related protein 6 [Drosophila busckii]|uniref:XK-related protein 6 n=1 Tax=Drosophila busckii TaxID=30019 RepID=UPI00083F0CDF|nr:XK-related protein 6 [Drosophila busckii]
MDYDYAQTMEGMDCSALSQQITIFNIALTLIAALMRFISIVMNWCLAYEYWSTSSYAYCNWTIASILVPMILTSLIYSNVLLATNSGKKPVKYADHIGKIVLSYLFRDNCTLNWALKYLDAKKRKDKQAEIECYHRHLKEECNVGFVRLFDSFLESAPQKILQLAILLRYIKVLSFMRALTFLVYFTSIAWCLLAYNRSNRLVQLDKYNISTKGLIVQFWFLLCLTAARTTLIAFITSKMPCETFASCLVHIFLCGTLVYIVDKPKLAKSYFLNYLLCLTFGVVYLFIFTPVKDAPTKYKYIVYFTFCMLQNIVICVLYIPIYIAIGINMLYVLGIVLMIYYYMYCHPGIISAVY